MSNVIEYAAFKEQPGQTVEGPWEQFERVKAETVATLETAKEKLMAARWQLGGKVFADLVDGVDRALALLHGFDSTVERNVEQLVRMRGQLRTLFEYLIRTMAAGEPGSDEFAQPAMGR